MTNPWREDYPILAQQVYGRKLVYLDNAATSQVPRQVLERITEHYTKEHANVHRGVHFLSTASTSAVEAVRKKTAAFLHAPSAQNIVFTQGTTDSIHLVCSGLEEHLDENAGVLVSVLEHHSNFVPWQQACLRRGAPFAVCPA
ncbi:MAG: aminotransferase class V-fold PLP-dependent enzyme, partial [Lachnospiraceae bacterium]|nr:aminotransferase class V-fold PLP-dependent enzyme [Lachnospiraceae bacterium]